MHNCPRCGKSHRQEDRFCGFCGYNLTVQINSDFVTKQALKVSDIQFNLGVLYYKKGKFPQAMEIFEKILEESPDNLQVMDMYERTRTALNASVDNSTS